MKFGMLLSKGVVAEFGTQIAAAVEALGAAPDLTATTRGLIDARKLAILKPTASFINVARGEVVDEAALIDALQRKALAGAYLDEYAQEPLPVDSPLWDMPTVVMSPHNASSARGNEARGAGIFIENIGRLLRNEPLRNEYRAGNE